MTRYTVEVRYVGVRRGTLETARLPDEFRPAVGLR